MTRIITQRAPKFAPTEDTPEKCALFLRSRPCPNVATHREMDLVMCETHRTQFANVVRGGFRAVRVPLKRRVLKGPKPLYDRREPRAKTTAAQG